MEFTVESLCNCLAKYKLLDAQTVRSLRQRWLREGKQEARRADSFGRWLVAQRHLTEFQLGVLRKKTPNLLLVDQYTLLDRIGQGRMAGVYKARHSLGQLVAIKILPPSKANRPQILARFQREARMAARLSHPNVVRTFQQGKTENGLYYIVMEYVDGESLDEVLKRRQTLPPLESVHVGVQVLEGLQHIFEEGLVHRDLKPGNIMLTPGRTSGQPDTTLKSCIKILDIGLGRALFDEGMYEPPEQGGLTMEGSILGTARYMAPEQARSARTADIRADIYSLGCVLYETLSGDVPFSDASLMRQILRHATEPPRPLRDANPDVPEALQQVIEIMLAKDPVQRFSTPQQAAKALRGTLPSGERLPRPEDPAPKMRSFLTWLETSAQAETSTDDGPQMTVPAPSPEAALESLVEAAAAPAVADSKPMPQAPQPAATGLPESKPATPVNGPGSASAQTSAVSQGIVQKKTKPPAAIPIAAPSEPVAPGILAVPQQRAVNKPASTSPKAPSTEASGGFANQIIWQWRRIRVTVRDLLFMGIGAMLLLVLAGLFWLISWLIGV